MPKYIKKPIEVKAEPYKKRLEDGFACIGFDVVCYNNGICEHCESYKPFIDTLEGRMFIKNNDYIITGIKGERYPYKKEIFEMTYERID